MSALLFMANVTKKLGAFLPKFGTPCYSNWKYTQAYIYWDSTALHLYYKWKALNHKRLVQVLGPQTLSSPTSISTKCTHHCEAHSHLVDSMCKTVPQSLLQKIVLSEETHQ